MKKTKTTSLPSTCGAVEPTLVPPTRYLRLPEVLNILPISKSKFYELVASGEIAPPQKPCGRRISLWREADIIAFIEGKGADNA